MKMMMRMSMKIRRAPVAGASVWSPLSSPPDESSDKNWFLPFANPANQTWMLAILGSKKL